MNLIKLQLIKMTDWSKYPNFISNIDYRTNINVKENIIKKSKKLCFTDDKYFELPSERAVYMKKIKGPINSIRTIKFLNGQDWEKAWVEKIVKEEIEPLILPNLSFKFVQGGGYADVKILFKKDIYSFTIIGTNCINISQDRPSMQLGSLDFPKSRRFEFNSKIYKIPDNIEYDDNYNGAIIKHECCHVLGKFHEHQNPINNPIQWNVEKVLQFYKKEQPDFTEQDIYENVIKKLNVSQVDATPFDPLSIMMYTINSELTTNGIGFESANEFSKTDIEWFKRSAETNPTDYNKYIIIIGIIIFISFVILFLFFYKKNTK
jgi:hypothetical protein